MALSEALPGQPACTDLVLVVGADPLVRMNALQGLAAKCRQSDKKVAILANGEIFSIPDTSVHQQVFECDEALKNEGVRLIRLAPGCVCCSTRLILQTHLGRLMRLNRPDTLILELDSSTHQDKVLELVGSDQWKDWFSHVCVKGVDI